MIDSKQVEISINFLRIDSFKMSKEGRLNIVYYVPSDQSGLIKRNENYECFEAEALMKTFESIMKKLETAERTISEKIQGGNLIKDL